MTNWHRFITSSDDDLECVNGSCNVVVDERALHLLTVACPAPPCRDDNAAGGCVFVAGERGPVCAYCDAPGGSQDLDDEDDIDLDELLAGLEVDEDGTLDVQDGYT